MTQKTDTDSKRFCTFQVDNLLFGLDVSEVQEVVRINRMTRVPLAPKAITGLINLRGQIVTAVDLRNRLGLGPLPPDLSPLNVIVSTDDGPISLLVDEIGDVLTLSGAEQEDPPHTLKGMLRTLIRGVFQLENEVLMILDANQCMDFGNSLPQNHN